MEQGLRTEPNEPVEAVIMIDADGHVRGWSAGAAELFGFTAVEAIGCDLAELILPAALRDAHRDGLRNFANVRQLVTARGTRSLPAVSKDGLPLAVSVRLDPIDVGGQVWCVGVLGPVSLAPAEARPAAELVELLFERAPEAITLLDIEGRQLLVNTAGSMMTGYGAQPNPGAGSRLIHPDDTDRVMEHFGAVVRGERDPHAPIRYRILNGHGEWMWLEMLLSDLRDVTEVGAYVAFSRDVTADEELRSELVNARRAAEEAGERLRQLADARLAFAASASHELRTPLTSVSSAVQWLLASGLDDESMVQRLLSIIERNVGRLGRIIDDLLLLGRSEAGLLGFVMEPVDVMEVVHDAVVRVEPALASRHLSITVADVDGPFVRADPERLGQVFDNLFGNAAKFADDGTVVTVHCSSTDHGWRIEVLNEGPAIGDAERERIFDPFVRGESAVGGPSGSGLGLAVAREIVEAHGGTLTVAPELRAGACFVVELPLGVPAVATDASDDHQTGAAR